jgi:HSP20 family molecular chaperone IbpA
MMNTDYQSAAEVVLKDRFQFLNTVGPLERWEDDNYCPDPLKVEVQNNEAQFLVKAELPGVKPEQVNVNLSRGTLFILVTSAGENGEAEQYAEIPIPARFRTDKARLVFQNGALIIAVLPRRHNILKQLLTNLLPRSYSPHARAEGAASGD